MSFGLPNDSQIVATKVGTTRLDDKMSSKDILYVFGLTCNFLSMFQLIDDSNCIAAFSKHGCVLQDCSSKMLIGTGESRDGLYLKVDKLARSTYGRSDWDTPHSKSPS